MWPNVCVRKYCGRSQREKLLCSINRHPFVAGFLCCMTVLVIVTTFQSPTYSLSELDIPFYIPPLEPRVTEDFPVVASVNTTIPKIIHQIWNDYVIPAQMVDNIHVLLSKHPDWQYYFWTLPTGRLYIQKHFPRLLELYDSYEEPVDKSDLLRYAILFKYGGVFLDLDIRILRPLDRVVASYPCVVVREPPEHAAFLYNAEFYLANGVIFTRPGHPLFEQILNNVDVFRHNQRPCGTRMFTTNVLLYNRTIAHETKVTENSIYITPSVFFLHDIDPGLHKAFRNKCKDVSVLSALHQRGCASYVQSFILEDIDFPFTFTKHLWAHTLKTLTFHEGNDIRKIAPSVKLYTENDE